MKFRNILGVDFGGSGIKGAPVDTKEGLLLAERFRIPTPDPSNPQNVIRVIKEIVKHFRWKGPIGVAFPAVAQGGVIKTASNIDKCWIGVNAAEMLKSVTGLPAHIVNDADAAGMAEMKFGAGQGVKGSVLLVTVGTGIGTVFFTKGKLLPNTELGHLYLESGIEAENFASDAVRKKEDLDWKSWGKRFNDYLQEMERLFWPDLIIIGGGVSKKPDLFMEQINVKARVEMANSRNEAGILGAAISTRTNKDILRGL